MIAAKSHVEALLCSRFLLNRSFRRELKPKQEKPLSSTDADPKKT